MVVKQGFTTFGNNFSSANLAGHIKSRIIIREKQKMGISENE